MSVSPDVKPAKKRTFLRIWLPCLILGITAAVITGAWALPDETLERSRKGSASIMTVMVAVPLIAGWLIFLSGWRWRTRGAVLLAGILVGGFAFANVEFDGDMVPSFPFWKRWVQQARLEAHRKEQSRAAALKLSDIVSGLATNFPEYRGRKRDGVIVGGPSLARDWSTPPPKLWRQPIGGGYASFAVAGNAIVTIEQRRDGEAVVCYDSATGREHWVHTYPAFFQEKLGGNGPRATPTIDADAVFSLGATGVLCYLDLLTGDPKWSTNILEGNANLQWGMSGSPLVYDQIVVVSPGMQQSSPSGGAVVAYDRNTGQLRWRGGDTKAGYSSPMLATLAGKRQIVLLEGKQLGGYDADNGHPLWQYPWEAFSDINCAQPLVLDGDRIFLSSGYDKGCAMLKVSESDGHWSAKALWGDPPAPVMRCKFSSPVALNEFIYGLDDGILACVDANTGKRKWKGGRYGHGQLVVAGNLLVILSDKGKLVLVEAMPESYRELGSFQAIEGKTWNNFAISNGRVFVRNAEEMACYDLTKK
jgi:outer membrane protein assembly factor BamB